MQAKLQTRVKAKTVNQRDYCRSIIENIATICTGPSGCVDEETEYLSQDGWKKISDYQDSDMVMQYDTKTKKASLCKPINYIKIKSDGFFHIKSKRGIDQKISKEHIVIYETSKGNFNKKSAFEFVEQHNNSKLGHSGKFILNYDFDGKDLQINEHLLRLQVAIKADAYLANPKTYYYIFNLKRQRKIERLKVLLKNANIKYNVWTNEKTNYTHFSLNLECSKFLSDWMFCSKKDAIIIFDELKYWDGRFNTVGNRLSQFYTSIKKDADFVQYIHNILGYKSYISTYNRIGQKRGKYIRKNKEYTVTPTKQNRLLLERKNKLDIPFIESTETEYKYCFTVPTGALVLRRNNNVFITGNSGKTMLAAYIACSYLLEDKIESIVLTRPMVQTGKGLGFLPGNVLEKTFDYLIPLYEYVEMFLGKEELKKLLATKVVQICPLELMRGRTYHNSFILLDEVQNASYKQILMCLTRVGDNTKIVLNGDIKQSDLPFNEFGEIISKLENTEGVGIIHLTFDDILRSPFIKQILSKLDS